MMKEAELEAMAEDIEEHGLRHRVVYRLVQSELGEVAEILDGRNRLEALEIVRLPLLKDNKLNPAYFEKASQKALADIPATSRASICTAGIWTASSGARRSCAV